ncbi:Yersinia protein of uncharacterised function (DUF3831) [Yersinia enterocolitica]|nr:Yersinia protein of uncharacterised function (DUF3831) [Yersinia enterocolitica]
MGRRVKRPRQGWRGASHQGRKASAPGMARLEPTWMYLTASLRSACSLRSGHFVNSLGFLLPELHYVWRNYGCTPSGAAPPIGVTTSLAAIALRPGNVLQAAPTTGGAVVG